MFSSCILWQYVLMVLIPIFGSSGKNTNIWSVGSSLWATNTIKSLRDGLFSLQCFNVSLPNNAMLFLTWVYLQSALWTVPEFDPIHLVLPGTPYRGRAAMSAIFLLKNVFEVRIINVLALRFYEFSIVYRFLLRHPLSLCDYFKCRLNKLHDF